jgi:hypothetical protein
MAFKKTPQQKAAEAAEKQSRESAKRAEQQRQAYLASPPGQARQSFERGDQVFQCSFEVMSQQAVIVQMVGSTTNQRTADPTMILNSVCREGWELVNGSFVFVEQGQQSRDKFMSSGQNVAIKGATVGYYLFRRCEVNRTSSAPPAAPASYS